MMPADRLSTTFAALADPTRRAILARLASGETSVTELAEPFAMSLPAVSKHLKVLERAGLIARGREAQWRPCRIEPGALRQVDDWLDRYRLVWDHKVLMGSDAPPGMSEDMKGFSVTLGIDKPAEAERIFHALAEDGTVRMPIQETFWATRFGMLTDRFGTPWMINCEKAAA